MYLILEAIGSQNVETTLLPDGTEVLRGLNSDPQLLLGNAGRLLPLSLPRGKYWFLVEMTCFAGAIIDPLVYIDVGEGFSETATSRIRGRCLGTNRWFFTIEASRRIRAIRFDPTEQLASFAIETMALLSEAARARFAHRSSKNPPARYFRRPARNAKLPAVHKAFPLANLPSIATGVSDDDRQDSKFYRKYVDDRQARVYACEDGRYFFHYAGLATDELGPIEHGVKTLAFYLPQMHPIPENDAWWGRGFTEWTNVSKAVSRYSGHYQPRLPGELGYYDLRLPEVLHRQAELARTYGLFGFCFYYYWFSGKTLLERPLELLLSDPNIDTRFCLCWANENWTRRWDGLEADVLVAQSYEPENAAAIFDDWLKYFRDPRYIRVEGRPLLLVYRPDLIPDFPSWADRWRRLSREAGFEGLYIVAASAFRGALGSTEGLDALYEFPPHNLKIPHIDPILDWFEDEHKTHAYSYRDGVEYALDTYRRRHEKLVGLSSRDSQVALHPGVLVGWDTEARKPGRGDVLHDATPSEFRRWAHGAFASAQETLPADRRFVFINAWNEWAEGAYLEPDRRHGYAYLTALRSVVREYGLDPNPALESCRHYNEQAPRAKRIAIFLHLFYFDLLGEFQESLDSARCVIDFDAIVTVPQAWTVEQIEAVVKRLRPRKIFALPNVGRDVFPFLQAARSVRYDDYVVACKLHSKKSTHRVDGDAWRHDLVAGLLWPQTLIDMQCESLKEAGHNFIAAPSWAFLALSDRARLAGNIEHFTNLTGLLNIDSLANRTFIAGTMFWFRFSVLNAILDLPLGEREFGVDLGQVDGTLAHAMERVFALLVEDRGGEVKRLTGAPRAPNLSIRI